ncbi:MAG: tRNA epoxyqueuosine(34) reductase QueG [Ignavibacteriae bacterium]|nr:tRNA epoxyqueuosine(34) reductase QueG [Ignavibacteriota bacterium]
MYYLTGEIKHKAIELGFNKVGIARTDFLEKESQQLSEWLARGYHGTMEWMARNFEKRVDPRNVLQDAKSVIAVAMNYYTNVQHSDDELTGKISRYAWGDDYHDIMAERLWKLLEFIQNQEPSAKGKVYVDTGPIMDKVWAQRAGIGWIGKHTNVITQDLGSWVFLGEIILDLELEYDAEATDHCGSCTLCIEACPTQAIVVPYVLDSNRCISYLTIEHKGKIPEEMADKFDRWIYGCDICQDVCPWNQKFSSPADVKEFFPRECNIAPNLHELEEMTEDEFRIKYRNSPMKRTKHAGLTRNAKAVMAINTTLESTI